MSSADARRQAGASKKMYWVPLPEATAFFDQDGTLITYTSNDDALYRSEYQNRLFEHFGVSVELLEVSPAVYEKIERRMEREDVGDIVESLVQPIVQKKLGLKQNTKSKKAEIPDTPKTKKRKRWLHTWEVPSSDGQRTYAVSATEDGTWKCACKGWIHYHSKRPGFECRHIKQKKAEEAAAGRLP